MNVHEVYRRALFEDCLREWGLLDIYAYVQNPEYATGLPYHNTEHCIRTAIRVWELSKALGFANYVTANIITAALFHDFMHAGRKPDSVNIAVAVAGLQAALCVHDRFDEGEVRHIVMLIKDTEYPYTKDPVHPHSAVLRDADLLESIEPNHIEILEGLRKEVAPDLPVTDFIARQIEFMKTQPMFTRIGKHISEATYEARKRSFILYEAMQEPKPAVPASVEPDPYTIRPVVELLHTRSENIDNHVNATMAQLADYLNAGAFSVAGVGTFKVGLPITFSSCSTDFKDDTFSARLRERIAEQGYVMTSLEEHKKIVHIELQYNPE